MIHLLLLILLTLGVMGMHTLGHMEKPPATSVGHEHPQEEHHSPDPTTMCLAVLVAGVGLVLVAAALWVSRTRSVISTPAAWIRGFASGLPPPRPPELCSLQVLRI